MTSHLAGWKKNSLKLRGPVLLLDRWGSGKGGVSPWESQEKGETERTD